MLKLYQIFLNGLGDFHDLNSDSKLDSNFLPKLKLDCLKTSENNMKKKLDPLVNIRNERVFFKYPKLEIDLVDLD